MADSVSVEIPEEAEGELIRTWHALRLRDRNDAAWCVAHAGTFLLGDRAPTEVADFAKEYAPHRPRRVQQPLDDGAWLRLLYHRDNDPRVGEIFESVLAPVRRVHAQPLKRFGLAVTEAIHSTTSKIALVRALGSAAAALGVPVPLIFVRNGQPGGLAHVPSDPIASVAGAGLLSGRTVAELAFVAGHHMTLYRADHYARVLYRRVDELTTLFRALLKIAQPDLSVPANVKPVVTALQRLLRDEAPSREASAKLAQLFMQRGEPVDLVKWAAGVERTALRAGLLLSGDLFVASRLVGLLPGQPADALADLCSFAMSEAYFALRQKTGIALWQDGTQPMAVHESEPSGAWSIVESARVLSADTALFRSVEVPLVELPDSEVPVTVEDDLPFLPMDVSLDGLEQADGEELEESRQLVPTAMFARAKDHGGSERPFCVAAVWMHRARGDVVPDAVRTAYESGRMQDVQWRLRARLRPADWEDIVRDRGELRPIGALMASLIPAVREALQRTPADYGLDPVAGPARGTRSSSVVAWVAALLGVQPPTVFEVADLSVMVSRPPCDPPVLLVDPERIARLSTPELEFLMAEHLSYFRDDRVIRVLVPRAAALDELVRAIVDGLCAGSVSLGASSLASDVLNVLGKNEGHWREVRQRALAVASDDLPAEVASWCAATERTAARAAIFASLDFDAAAAVVNLDRGAPSDVPASQKQFALETWALTPEFADVRERAREGAKGMQ